jgi:hypothetical protein
VDEAALLLDDELDVLELEDEEVDTMHCVWPDIM